MPLRALLVLSALFFAPMAPLLAAQSASAAGRVPPAALPALSADRIQGLPVRDIVLETSTPSEEAHLRELITIKPNDPYEVDKVRESIERLYSTGRFFDIQVDAQQKDDGIRLTFLTKENYFIGGVFVAGVPEPPSPGQLASATKLRLGELLTQEKITQAIEGLQRALEDNGYYQARIDRRLDPDPGTQQTDIFFDVIPGERARIAETRISGNPVFPAGRLVEEARLKPGKELSAKRLQNAINRLRRFYQKKEYLEASIGIAERRFLPPENRVALTLSIDAGPQVEVKVTGAKLSGRKRREVLPIYDEGSVDADLIREGENNLRDHFQRRGHFDVDVAATTQESPDRKKVIVEYHVKPGPDHQVALVEITGNRYFDSRTIRERMFVAEKGLIDDGRYSRQYLARDVEAIRALYVANGFPNVNVTSSVEDNYRGKKGDLVVRIRVEEGIQTLVNDLKIEGPSEISKDELMGLVASGAGQPYSDFNVMLDRDTLLTYYFNNGFSRATFTPEVRPAAGRPDRMDLVYRITEGPRQHVSQVLINGLEKTQRHIVGQQVQVRAGQPLSQADMLQTQRGLYDLGVFQKVEMALQNPEGEERHKNVLLQVDEARLYTISVGGGADIARFGGDTESLEETAGRTGFSPRISFDVTRLNFRGLNHTLALKTRLSTLQKRALISYTAPRVWNVPNLTLVFNSFYDRSFDVLTFASERLEGSVALEQKRANKDTLIYRYSYRRVRAERDTLKVSVDLIPLFARPVRVGMLGATFVRDRRDDPADSRRGMFLTVDAGIATRGVGSQTSFARAAAQYTTYHRLSPTLVLARNTQFGLADPFGRGQRVPLLDTAGEPVLDPEGRQAFQLVRDIPLPERFFSGGGNSHRGFGVNQAGPRDAATGFPVGGGALLLNSVELRFPLLGPNIGGALFHDMGNVFASGGDISLRFHQRDRTDFNYMVHALGVGVRYKTPIGPVRLDLAWSINPPSFFGLTGTRNELLAGTGRRELRSLSHFQFFFSIGQTY